MARKAAISRWLRLMARQSLAAGNLDGAQSLIDEASRQDPNDPEIAALKKGKNPFNEETLRKLRLAAK